MMFLFVQHSGEIIDLNELSGVTYMKSNSCKVTFKSGAQAVFGISAKDVSKHINRIIEQAKVTNELQKAVPPHPTSPPSNGTDAGADGPPSGPS